MDVEKQIIPSQEKLIFFDPKNFDQIITKDEIKRFLKGEHYDIYNLLGAHKKVIRNIEGIHFSVWAPNAKQVFLLGEFLDSPLEMKYVEGGIFEIFVPKAKQEDRYLFEVVSKDGTKQQN